MKTSEDLYQVIAYFPESYTCNLAPATQNARGILRNVPIGCFWGGSWDAQQRYSPPFPNGARVGSRWGIGFPVQQGDYAVVRYLDQTTAYIAAFLPGWRGVRGPAYQGQQIGEPIVDRFDLLHPSGSWVRILQDGTWKLTTPENTVTITIDAGGSVTVDAEKSIHLNAKEGIEMTAKNIDFNASEGASWRSGGAIDFEGEVHVTGSQDINSSRVMVIGGRDSDGDTMVSDGQ